MSAYQSLLLLFIVIAMLASKAAASCPSNLCHCEVQGSKTIINCRGKGLEQVPQWRQDPSVPFYELTLAGNRISALDNNSFQGLNIKRLDLSDNRITNIHMGAFNTLQPYLEELVLHVNNMGTFPTEALKNLTKLRLLFIKGFNIPALPINALSTHTLLQSLKIESCSLQSISTDDVSAFKTTLQELAMPFNELNQLPASAVNQLENLVKLDLQHNSITRLEVGAFPPAAKITALDFSNNQIHTIQQNAFAGLETSLTHLVLKSNKLTDNQLQPIGVLVNLQEINLAYNSIVSIPPTTFVDMQNLQILNLRGNRMRNLEKEPFAPIGTTLIDLELAENIISSIESGMFQGFTMLQQLQMDDQFMLGILDETTFEGLEGSLQRLSLRNVGFITGNFAAIKNLGQLRSLALANNNIQSIPDMAFEYLSRLEKLDLSNNSIDELSQRALHGMQTHLKEINLNNNKITSISQCAFYKFTGIEFLKLGKNPLRCDCDLVWLRKWIAQFENDTIKMLLIDWRCSTPDTLKDRLFRRVAVGELCDINPTPPICEEIVVSTTQQTLPSGASTPDPDVTVSPIMLINVTQITDASVLLSWTIQDSGINGFKIETVNRASSENLEPVTVLSFVRKHRLENLMPSTTYVTCITTLYQDQSRETQTCRDFQTKKQDTGAVSAGPNTGLIVGAVIGSLALIALLIFLGFIFVRSRGDGDSWLSKLGFGKGLGTFTKKSHTPTGIPRMGYNSKRFSRPRGGATASTTSSVLQLQNNSNLELEKKLAGFSAEERDRILNILTTTGGSTASIISTGSSQRYAPELPPRPQSLEGYLNPQSVKDEYLDPDAHIYAEIPAAGADGGYEIPRHSVRDSGFSTASGKYENCSDPQTSQTGECYI